MILLQDDLLKIALALLIGGLIGVEREFRDKAAGFRTLIFICVGATLFTIFSSRLGAPNEHARIAANIVVGVGFLGAGVILRGSGGRLTGLTTAATIWLTAALGMGIGAGSYLFSGIVAVISFVVLWLFPRLEGAIVNVHTERSYEIQTPMDVEKLQVLKAAFQSSGLHFRLYRQDKSGERLISYWASWGTSKAHERLLESLLEDPDILELKG